MSPKGASDEQGADEERNSENISTKMKPNTSTNDNSVLPKSCKSTNGESNSIQEPVPKNKGNMERREKRSGSIRSRGSNIGDSSELEASETDETDERRISSRRDQDCGSSSRSRTPERPGSDFGGSPGPFSSHQQQQFLQAGIPYLHLLPAHIRNDAARLFLMPQMLPPELAAAAAAAAAATSTSNQSPSPGASGGVNSNINASQTVMPSSSAGGTGKSEKTSSGENSRSGAMYVCEPCNIKFSSSRTLEAHQTYYCSFRKDLGRIEGDDGKSELMMQPSGSGSSSKKRDRENSDEHEMTMDESMESIDSFSGSGMNQSKNLKTGKLYSCIFCSYSADKKVSLNRHMRMHSGLSISNQMPNTNSKDEQAHLSAASIAAGTSGARPVTPGKSSSVSSSAKNVPESVSALERYCQDCDIQFSSIKTYRVHKQYYCSTRHVLKAQHSAVAAAVAASGVTIGGSPIPSAALGKAPVELGPGVTVTPVGKSSASVTSACSPIPGDGSPVSTPGPLASQPFVVLPTNPIIVVPYCFIQGASFLPGNVLPSHNAIIVLPNGTVQSLPGSANATGGIPIPVPSPSPQSMLMGSHMMMHSPFPTSATPGPSNMGLMSPNNLAFPDPKEMMKLMSSSSGQKGSRGDEDLISSNKLQKPSTRNSGRSSRSSDESSNHHEHHTRSNHSHGNEACDDSMPAIDLTFRGIQPKKELASGGDEEKENREVCAASRSSRNVSHESISGTHEEGNSRSATPATSGPVASASTAHHNMQDSQRDRESVSPLEKMSLGSGSGGKRTPRPSSASVSSSCSTPPALCEPKLNGMISHIMSPGVKDQHDSTSLNNKMVMMMLNAGAAAAAAAAALEGNGSNGSSSRGGKAIKGSAAADYNSVLEMTRSRASSTGEGKISPVATQLPGGAILTSASNQSLAELLMTNPPELNESLAKLNPQLLMNAHRASGSPVGFNFNLNPAFMQALSPEIAMRLLDPAYLSSLQQSIQQQQQQQQQASATAQTAQGPVKRGVSKCIECDIVFYKYENYLVHKEHYCAARANTNASGSSSNVSFPQSKTPTGKLPHGKNLNIRDNGNHRSSSVGKDACRMSSCSSPSKSEIGDDECISPPPPVHRKGSISTMRKSPDSSSIAQSLLLTKPKTKSPPNPISSPVHISPAPSPSGSHHSNSSRDHGKGANSSNANNQYPCSICGVKFSTIDNLQTHQFYYCNKRKGSSSCDNAGDNEFCGESKNGSSSNGNNGEAMIMGLPTNNALHEKDLVTGVGTSRNKSPGPGSVCRNGFQRCGKCKLPIPEDQMSTHIRVCLGTSTPSFGNGSRVGESGGIGVGAPVGWKCPCCDVYSPTVSAAQKHLETHTGIRAFKCLLCGYRGNTLRGMRTHIRTHFDRRVCDLLEGDYMTCITANDVDPPAPTNTNNNSNSSNSSNNVHAQLALNATSPPLHPDQILRTMPSPTALAAVSRATAAQMGNEIAPGVKTNNNTGVSGKHSRSSPEASKSVNQSSTRGHSTFIRASCSPSPPPNALNDEISSDVKIFQSPSEMMMMTMMTENDSNTSAENNNQLHYCNLCNYSSPYKGSILKHMKLVHKVPLDISSAEEAAALMMMQGDHEGLATMSMMMNRGEMSERMIMDDVNGTSRDSSRNSTPKSTLDYAMSQGFSIAAGKSLSPAVAASLSESCSTRSRRATSTVVPNGTSGLCIKEERSESEGDCAERKCSSQSSAEDDINGGAATSTNKSVSSVEKQQQSSTTGSSSSGAASGNYCKSCDISFNYVSSFNAHKKFYCSSHISSDTEPQERAETPVQ
ncbi:unnamed protein product [Orchesella dallaii]